MRDVGEQMIGPSGLLRELRVLLHRNAQVVRRRGQLWKSGRHPAVCARRGLNLLPIDTDLLLDCVALRELHGRVAEGQHTDRNPACY